MAGRVSREALEAYVDALDARARSALPTVSLGKGVFAESIVYELGLVDPETGEVDLEEVTPERVMLVEHMVPWAIELFARVACRLQVDGAVAAVAERYLLPVERRIRKRREADPDRRIASIRRALLDGPESAIASYRWGSSHSLGRFLQARALKLDAALRRQR